MKFPSWLRPPQPELTREEMQVLDARPNSAESVQIMAGYSGAWVQYFRRALSRKPWLTMAYSACALPSVIACMARGEWLLGFAIAMIAIGLWFDHANERFSGQRFLAYWEESHRWWQVAVDNSNHNSRVLWRLTQDLNEGEVI